MESLRQRNNNTNKDALPFNERKERIFEVLVFLFLILPSMVLSSFAMKPTTLSFVLVAYSTILRDLSLASLIFFFIWRNREPIQRIGWTLKNSRREVILGIGLFIPFSLTTGALENVLRAAGLSVPTKPLPLFLTAKGPGEILLASILVIIVAITEETIFRGYLLLRFKNITLSRTFAVLLSAAIFSIGHGYEGSAGVITVGVMGALFALIYLWRQSLVAPFVMHFMQDFIGIVLMPLLK